MVTSVIFFNISSNTANDIIYVFAIAFLLLTVCLSVSPFVCL